LREKNAYVVCTSICDEPSVEFVGAFLETFNYLGMHFGGVAHVNCREGYLPAIHDAEAVAFSALVRGAVNWWYAGDMRLDGSKARRDAISLWARVLLGERSRS
jgi:hypothetical protein